MVSIYLKPLGLVFGDDARQLISTGDAGALGGMAHIGFTLVEETNRGGARKIMAFADCEHDLSAHTAERATFGGLELSSTRLMGIVNVTPDSFSDGGKFVDVQAAIRHGRLIAKSGADILDIGGESTRPGSDVVSDEEEAARVIPVVAGLAADHVVSIDTRKAGLMMQALRAGAKIINDVSALGFEAQSAEAVAKSGAPIVLMHAQGDPKTMQLNPTYDDVVLDVYDALAERIASAEAAGISRGNICIDPGIGFGKTFQQNLQILNSLTMFHGLGVAMLVGLSRKAFVGALTGVKVAGERVHGSVGGAIQASMAGAHILRVHDVAATRQAINVFTASLDPNSVEI